MEWLSSSRSPMSGCNTLIWNAAFIYGAINDRTRERVHCALTIDAWILAINAIFSCLAFSKSTTV